MFLKPKPAYTTVSNFLLGLLLTFASEIQVIAEVFVEPLVLEALNTTNEVNVLITLKDHREISPVLRSLPSTALPAKRMDHKEFLQQFKGRAEQIEKIRQKLEEKQNNGARTFPRNTRSLWVTNQMVGRKLTKDDIETLKGEKTVDRVTLERIFPVILPTIQESKNAGDKPWGVAAIGAPEVWKTKTKNKGNSAVVGIIDTGVRGSHEALKKNFKGKNGWYDPRFLSPTPADYHGHGTHVAGVILGRTKNIGVAPEAKWAACKAINEINGNTSTTDLDLLECLQWVICPANSGNIGGCGDKPNIVFLAWDFFPNSTDSVVTFWTNVFRSYELVGITSVFSSGDKGPDCATIKGPGSEQKGVTVSSIDNLNHTSKFGSCGPAKELGTGSIISKPDIAAPGENIYSAGAMGDSSYSIASGTSMAAAHFAGVAALVYNIDRRASYKRIMDSISKAAVPVISDPSQKRQQCSNHPESHYPNYYVGHGHLDAVRFINNYRARNSAKLSSYNPCIFVLVKYCFNVIQFGWR